MNHEIPKHIINLATKKYNEIQDIFKNLNLGKHIKGKLRYIEVNDLVDLRYFYLAIASNDYKEANKIFNRGDSMFFDFIPIKIVESFDRF